MVSCHIDKCGCAESARVTPPSSGGATSRAQSTVKSRVCDEGGCQSRRTDFTKHTAQARLSKNVTCMSLCAHIFLTVTTKSVGNAHWIPEPGTALALAGTIAMPGDRRKTLSTLSSQRYTWARRPLAQASPNRHLEGHPALWNPMAPFDE